LHGGLKSLDRRFHSGLLTESIMPVYAAAY
jgi:hypothetical protein